MTAWSLAARARGERDRVRADDGRAARRPPVAGPRGAPARRLRGPVDLRQPDAVRAERGSRPLPARPAPATSPRRAGAASTSPSRPRPRDVYPPGSRRSSRCASCARLCGPFRPGHFAGVATVVASCSTSSGPTSRCSARRTTSSSRSFAAWCATWTWGSRSSACRPCASRWARAVVAQRLPVAAGARARAVAVARAVRGARRARPAVAERRGHRRRGAAALDFDRIDYVELVDAETLRRSTELERPAVIAVAAFIGRTRLIDNVRVS